MEKVNININDNVKLRLTEYGRTIHKDHFSGRLGSNAYEQYYCPDDDGYVTMQLWEVMQVFGSHLHLGNEMPFETNIQVNT